MTSLAKQLQRLAVPHTQAVLGEDKERASLLFDPKEAANLDREAVFAIGQSGLEELANIDDRFMVFEESLFSFTSQNWERSLQTKEVNEKLDEMIQEFLILLSPYFPLKSAHKTLEWLIYRYHIHHFNKDDLLLCILPYHEMKIFIRVLQLLKLDNPADKWNWLEACAKNGVALARNTLINHCSKDPGFMAFILEIVPNFIKVHGADSQQLHAVTAFFTCTMLGVLQYKENITEKMLSVIVPHMIRGFGSKCLEYRAANYMLLSQLVVQVQLKEDLLGSLLPVLSKRLSNQLTQEGLACLALVFQTQKVSSMPKRTFKHICKVPGILLLLTHLSGQYNIDGMLKAWLERLIPAAMRHGDSGTYSCSSDAGESEMSTERPQYASLLQGVLSEVKFASDELLQYMIRLTVQALIEKRLTLVESTATLEDWSTLTRNLLVMLERRHNTLFDKVVEEVMSLVKGDKPSLGVFEEIMSLTKTSIKYQVNADTSTSILLGLKHHSASVRILTLGHIEKCVKKNMDGDISFLKPLLLERLQDDHPGVVLAVLQLQSHLTEIIGNDQLMPALLKLVRKSVFKKKWCNICVAALRLLCTSHACDTSYDLLPYMVILNDSKHRVSVAKVIMEHLPGELHNLLHAIRAEWLELCNKTDSNSSDAFIKLNMLVINSIVEALQSLNPEEAVIKVNGLIDRCSNYPHYRFLVMCCLGNLVSNVTDTVKVTVMNGLLKLLTIDLEKASDKEKSKLPDDLGHYDLELRMPECLHALLRRSSYLPPSLAVWCLCCLVKCLNGQKFDAGNSHFIRHHEKAAPVIKLLDVLMCQASPVRGPVWRRLVLKLITKTLPMETTLSLFCYIWTWAGCSEAPITVTAHLHIASFYMFCHLLDKLRERKDAKLLLIEKPTIVCLILSLCHPEDCVSSVMTVMKKLKDLFKDSLGSFHLIIKKLIKRPHVPDVMLMKLFNPLLLDSDAAHKVTKNDLELLLHWLNVEDAPTQMKLNILQITRRVHPQLLLESLLLLAEDIIKTSSVTGFMEQSHEMLLFRTVLDRIFESDVPQDVRCANVLFDALKTTNKNTCSKSPQYVALDCVNSKLFAALSDLELQKKLVSTLLDIGEKCVSSELLTKVRRVLKKLHLRGCHVLHELQVKQSSEVQTVKGKKRSRVSVSVMPLNYLRLTLLLEVIQSHQKIKDREQLAEALFGLLSRLLEEDEEDTEFCKQMTLGCLYNITVMWNENTKPENQDILKIEDVVQCIRNSASPQTQQQALMLMTAVAPLYPEFILHHVMSVFTFMGSCMLQQDDAYSFQLITKTLDTIIPALIKACTAKDVSDNDKTSLIEDILRVFVDAHHHIPKHRCMPLFRRLIEQVGIRQHLSTVIIIHMENAVRTKDVPVVVDTVVDITEEGKTSVDKEIEFMSRLVEEFDVDEQLHSLTEVIHFLNQLCLHLLQQQGSSGYPETKKSQKAASVMVIAVRSLTPQQLRLIQYCTIRLIVRVLNTEKFINGINSRCSEDVIPEDLIHLFQSFMQQCLSLVTLVARGHGLYGNISKFWRASLARIYEILDKVNILLPNSIFLSVVSSLLDHEALIIQKKALELLNNKTQLLAFEHLSTVEVQSLLSFIPKLLEMSKSSLESCDNKTEQTTLRQLALYSLKLLCKLLGSANPKHFLQLFSVSLDIITNPEEPTPIIASGLLCLAELCSSLRVQALPYLPKFMPPLMTVLKDPESLKKNELLLVCGLTAIQKTIGSLSQFLSPYLLDILLAVCQITTFVDSTDSGKKNQPIIRLKAVRHQLATAVLPRVLVPAVAQSLETILNTNQKGLVALFDIIKEHTEQMEKEDLASQHNALINFYCLSLDLRNATLQLSYEEMESVEDVVIDAVITMVMKLSENTFRPVFYKFYDWACSEETITFKNRRLTFFRMAERLSDKLKSLFNLFIGHAIKGACDVLNKNNTKNGDVDYYGSDAMARKKSNQLITYTMDCLYKCFLHDTEGFINKEMFNVLLHPLVDQLENMLDGELTYQERVTGHVIPCLSQLSLAVHDDSCWKALNYQVLLKTRHNSPKVRFATLQAVEDLASKLGDEYMMLLPETVPFLAELMEDDSEEVEQKCQEVIASLETVLGESIQQYF